MALRRDASEGGEPLANVHPCAIASGSVGQILPKGQQKRHSPWTVDPSNFDKLAALEDPGQTKPLFQNAGPSSGPELTTTAENDRDEKELTNPDLPRLVSSL